MVKISRGIRGGHQKGKVEMSIVRIAPRTSLEIRITQPEHDKLRKLVTQAT